jgi:branched-chain amino acid transport system ATP-binding protein
LLQFSLTSWSVSAGFGKTTDFRNNCYIPSSGEDRERISMLSIENLWVSYGRNIALRGVSLTVGRGEIAGIIGSNGAGKSTLLRAISGLKRPERGTLSFDGKELNNLDPEDIARHGLTMVPEGRHIFQTLTVRENLMVPAPGSRLPAGSIPEMIIDLFPVLGERLDMRAGNLSGGEQQQLAIARALVMRPRMVTLDEPSLGLAPMIIEKLYECFRRLRAQGVTLLIIEQNAARILAIADHAHVMHNGRIVIGGQPDELRMGTRLEDAYFGRVSVTTEAKHDRAVSQ